MADSKDDKHTQGDKRKKDKHSDEDEYRKEKKAKRRKSRSKSPTEDPEKGSRRKRRHSRSPSKEKSVKQEKSDDASKPAESQGPVRKNRDMDMLNTRTGGAYIPPARLRMMQAQITDKSSMAFQRLAWEALKKSIHGHINKINVGNIGIIIKELLKENIVRGRGLLCRSVIQAQAASPTFTNVYAALVAAVNSRFPNIGELLLKRLVIQFKRGFKRNDKSICISSASFIAHLVNQRVAHEILALELLTLLVETPTDDSVEVAIAFLKECGQKLTEVSSKGVNAIFEMLRNILHEGQLDKRVQYMIEVMFQVWKDGFKDHPALIEELELVPEEEQFTHLLMLDDATDPQDILNVFKLDEKYEENEQKYKTLCKEILGSDADSDDDGEEGSDESGSEESDEEEDGEQKPMTIIDNTETNLVALRRTIYLTINSSLDFEECAHKLMKMQLKPGQEVELCHMFLDCCAEQRTYEKFYGLLAQRFCNINRIYIEPFEEIFKDSYATAHRLDTNRLRNVSKFFAHLLFTDSIGWGVLECVKLNEEDTTSSSRIYIKILFQELAEYMGLKKLNDRLKDPTLQEAFSGVFPRDNPKNTRFSINFFTSIGLGGLTDELREHLKQMPKNVPPPITEINIESDSESSSSSSSSSSSDSSSSDNDDSGSDSDENGKKDKSKKKKKDKTPATEAEKPVERWGHDGFYDTYGQDARRHERPEKDRDGDVFARPREVRRDGRNNEQGDRSKRDEQRRRDNDDREDSRNRRDDNSRGDDRHESRNKHVDDKDDPRNRRGGADREDVRNRQRDDRDVERNRRGDDREDPRNRRGDDRVDARNRGGDDRDDVRNRRGEDARNRRGDDTDGTRNRRGDDRDDARNRRGDDRDDSRNRRDDKSDSRSRRNDADDSRKLDRDRRPEDDKRRNKNYEDFDIRDDRDSHSKSDKRRDRIDDSSRDRDDRRRDRNDVDSRRKDDDFRRKDDRRLNKYDDSNSKRDKENYGSREHRKKDSRSKHKKDDSDSSGDDSSEEDRRKRRKDRRKKGDSDSSEEESRSKSRKDKKHQPDDDGWDIRRQSSVRREIPATGRYWDT